MVVIAYGKGVILKEPYEKMDGNFFYNFIKTHFNLMFGKAGRKAYRKRIFVMDNDPCQTSKKAMSAINQIECELHASHAKLLVLATNEICWTNDHQITMFPAPLR